MPAGIYIRTKRHRKILSDFAKTRTGLKNPMFGKVHPNKGKPLKANWKGLDAGYVAKHRWIQRRKGKAKKCFDCKTTKGRIEWSNKDHKYSRDPDDYKERCQDCHTKYDKKHRLK